MLVLGIESTCDETGVAVSRDGYCILANQVISQVALHERFGGVVPEIASRAHAEVITRLVESALRAASIAKKAGKAPVDLVAVAHRPGLIGALIVGVTAAKCLALAWDVPLVGVDHVHAHIYSVILKTPAPDAPPDEKEFFPSVSLVVSGGHTALYSSRTFTEHRRIGNTTDDAAGEAFDKVAALLELGYPGGPLVSRAAAGGDREAIRFPRTLLGAESLDFSFSGIKTAVRYHVKGQNAVRTAPLKPGIRVEDVAASFETAVVDVLLEKLRRAVRREKVEHAIVAGGVAANRHLRERLADFAAVEGVAVHYPDLELCTDNGAMIAALGFQLWKRGTRHDLTLDAFPMTT